MALDCSHWRAPSRGTGHWSSAGSIRSPALPEILVSPCRQTSPSPARARRAGISRTADCPSWRAQTPPALTYQNGDIRALYGTMQAVANAALATIATVGALNGLLRPHFGLRYHSLSEFVPRLLVGAILVNTALWWVQFAVDVNNAL